METKIKGKVSKKQEGYVTINKVNYKLRKKQYRYVDIGDTLEIIQGFFKSWKIKTIRFKNPLKRYLIGIEKVENRIK